MCGTLLLFMHKQNMPNLDELYQLWSFRLNVVDIERLINKDPMVGHCACWILCDPFTIRVQFSVVKFRCGKIQRLDIFYWLEFLLFVSTSGFHCGKTI
jgi:hypothetical protein